MNSPQAILKSKLEVTAHVADRLVYSIRKAQNLGLVPLTLNKLESLSDDEMETMDAYLFRYGSLVSVASRRSIETDGCFSWHCEIRRKIRHSPIHR